MTQIKAHAECDVRLSMSRKENAAMETLNAFRNLRWRVLEEIDPEYQTPTARCLETGTTVTADDPSELRRLITQALQLHIKLAAERKDPEALYRQRAAPDVWVRYDMASADEVLRIKIDVNVLGASRRGVQSEISIAQTFDRETA
jgi:hypothetical protein